MIAGSYTFLGGEYDRLPFEKSLIGDLERLFSNSNLRYTSGE